MESSASRHADSPRPMSFPHKHIGPRDEHAMDRSEAWLGTPENTYPRSNGSRRNSDRSTSSSRFTGPEPPSEEHLESSLGPEIVPPSPPALALDRHHNRTGSGHSFDSGPDYKNMLSKRLYNPQRHLVTPPPIPPVPKPNLSNPSFIKPPPPPPDFSSSRRRRQLRDDSDSDDSSTNRPAQIKLDWRTNSPRAAAPPFTPGQPSASSIVIPPPPPPAAPPQHSQSRRFETKPNSRKREKTEKLRSRVDSDRSGSSTFSYSQSRRARALSASSDSSGEGVDPVSARNARVFPPRFPAATTRAAPPTKSAAIHNITSWVHQYERQRARVSSHDAPFLAPPPPPTHGLGKIRDDELSSFEGSNSEASSRRDFALADTIEHLWQALKDKRAKVAEIKSEMSQQRRELRALRRKRDDADNALMNVLRPMLINHRSVLNMSPTILRERLFEVQDGWNDYNHREAMYEGLELLLDEEEESLSYTEIRFFSVLAAGRTEQETAPQPKDRGSKAKTPFDVPLELRGISPEGPIEELHPHYIKLTSTVGDLQNAKEQHAELQAEREALEEDIAVKKSTNQEVPLHTVKSLEESRIEEQRLRQRVESLRTQTDKLKKTCEKEGVMRKHMSIGMQYFLDPTVDYESEIELEDELPVANPLRHARFPELLSQPDHIMADPLPLTTLAALRNAEQLPMDDPKNRETIRMARKEHIVECLLQGRERQSKSEFVNRWLLQILQQSPLEASCLYETFISQSKLFIRNTTLWQKDVLHYWFRDETVVQYDEDPDQVSDERKNNGSVGGFYADTPPMSKAMSRAESAPLRSMSPISRATHDSSAKTLDGNFYLPETNVLVDVGNAKQSANTWSATTSPQMMIAHL